VLWWGAGDKMPAPLCQTQLSGPAGLWRCLPPRPGVWSKDGRRHPSGDPGICQSWAAASFPGEPSFQDSQLLLWGGSEGLSPEGPGVTGELRAALGLRQCLAGPAARRLSHTCSEPHLCSAPCFLLLADSATLSPWAGRVIFNCLPCAA